MTIQGTGTRETVSVEIVGSAARVARLRAEDNDGDVACISLDANHLRVLAKLAEAAADELDARSVAP